MKNKNLSTFIIFILFLSLNISLAAQPKNSLETIADIQPNSHLVHFKLNQDISLTNLQTKYKENLGLSTDNTLILSSSKTDKLGNQHHRLNQYGPGGFKIEGAQFIAHEKNGQIVKGNNKLISEFTKVNTTPNISEVDALEYAKNTMNAEIFAWEALESQSEGQEIVNYPMAELVWFDQHYSKNIEQYKLAYKFELTALQPYMEKRVYVDAQTGEILQITSLLCNICQQEVPAAGLSNFIGEVNFTACFDGEDYTLKNDDIEVRDRENYLPTENGSDPIFGDENGYFGDNPDGVMIMKSLEWIVEAYRDLFDRDGMTGNGNLIRAYVNTDFDFGNGPTPNNAVYAPSFDGLLFGSGDGDTYNSFASLEIAAHEFVHGVTNHTCNLNYQGESGALNESFSDVFGAYIEMLYHPNGGNWLMGDETVNGYSSFRNLSNPHDPTAKKQQPDTYLGQYWKNTNSGSDNGGVHTNSGVQNYFYYLLSEGDSGVNDNGYPYNVTGIGIDQAMQLAYHTQSYYLTENANYVEAREATIAAAEDYFADFDNAAEIIEQVELAWCAVGLGECNDATQDKTITLSQPNGGEVFVQGSNLQVQYYVQGLIETVLVEVSYSCSNDDFETLQILNNMGVSQGMFFWNIPIIEAPMVSIKVSDLNDPTVYDISDCFSIVGLEEDCEIVADFEINEEGPYCENIPYAFTLLEEGDANWSYTWQVNGETVGDDMALVYSFATSGNKEISLNIDDGAGCLATSTLSLDILSPVNPQFTYEVNGATVTVDAFSAENAQNLTWDFGDGFVTDENSPSHTYQTSGMYNICLTIGNECSEETLCKEVFVEIPCELDATFEVEQETPYCEDQLLTFVPIDGIDPTAKYDWFVDGELVSYEPILEYSFTTSGIKEIHLHVEAQGCLVEYTLSIEILLPVTPEFTYEINGLDVAFDAVSADNIEGLYWDFGDGLGSDELNPTHTYQTGGTYEACLTIWNECGSLSSCQTVTVEDPIDPCELLNAAFDIEEEGPYCTGNNYHFNLLFDAPSDWHYQWLVNGQIIVEYEMAFSYAFTQSGENVVQLNVNNGGDCWETHVVTVDILDPLNPNFEFETEELTASFFPYNDEDGDAWFWELGDGNTSTVSHPTHTYAESGTYYVCLTTSNSCNEGIFCQNVTVESEDEETDPCEDANMTAAFDFEAENVCISSVVTFKNQSENATMFEWKVNGILVSSSSVDLDYTFDLSGSNDVTLIAYNDLGCSTSYTQIVGVLDNAAVIGFDETIQECDQTEVTLEAGNDGFAFYFWDFGGQLVGTEDHLVATESGIYLLSVVDACGGVAAKAFEVILQDVCGEIVIVYPGDINNDSIVNMYDILVGGLSQGNVGYARENATLDLTPQPVFAWDQTQINGANIAHADANGNGVCDVSDFGGVLINYGETIEGEESEGFGFTFDYNPKNRVVLTCNNFMQVTDTLEVEINVTDLNSSDADLMTHGIAGSISPSSNLHSRIVEILPLDFSGSCLGDEQNIYSYVHHNEATQRIDFGITLLNDENKNCGEANVATLRIIINTALSNFILSDEEFTLEVKDLLSVEYGVGYNQFGGFYDASSPVEGGAFTFGSEDIEVPEEEENEDIETDLDETIVVMATNIYPNPAKDVVTLEIANAFNQNLSVEMTNTIGQRVFFQDDITPTNQQFQIATDHLDNGIYLIRLQDETGKNSLHKLVIQH